VHHPSRGPPRLPPFLASGTVHDGGTGWPHDVTNFTDAPGSKSDNGRLPPLRSPDDTVSPERAGRSGGKAFRQIG